MGQSDSICSKTNKKIYSVEIEIVCLLSAIHFLFEQKISSEIESKDELFSRRRLPTSREHGRAGVCVGLRHEVCCALSCALPAGGVTANHSECAGGHRTRGSSQPRALNVIKSHSRVLHGRSMVEGS